MDTLNYTFEIIVLLFKDGQLKKVSKQVSKLYLETYREVGYVIAQTEITNGWRVYSITIGEIKLTSKHSATLSL